MIVMKVECWIKLRLENIVMLKSKTLDFQLKLWFLAIENEFLDIWILSLSYPLYYNLEQSPSFFTSWISSSEYIFIY